MKYLYILIAFAFVGIAYIGILLPGVPTTFPALVALWFFGKSSPRLERWLKENRLFGRYLEEWESKRIIPKGGKMAMYLMLSISCAVFAHRFSLAAFFSFLALTLALFAWSLPYPENDEEFRELHELGRRKYTLRERIIKKRN